MRIVVCLSDSYTGDEFSDTYALDPTSGLFLDIDVDLDFDKASILDIYEYQHYCKDTLERSLFNITKFISARSFNLQMQRELEKAHAKALLELNFKEDQELNNEQYEAFSRRFTDLLMPYIEREVFRRRPATAIDNELSAG